MDHGVFRFDPLQEKTQQIIDVGEAFLKQTSESLIEYEHAEMPTSTGFMDKIKAMRMRMQRTTAEQQPSEPIQSKAENIEVAMIKNIKQPESTANHLSSSEIDLDGGESEFVCETTELDSESEAKNTDIEIVHSTFVQPADEFISFDAEDNVDSAVQEDRQKPRARLDWKRELSRKDLDAYHQAVIDDLVMISEPPAWFGSSGRQKAGEDEGWYRGNTMTEILDKEIDDFVEFVRPSAEDEAVRKFVVRNIADVIYKLWPFAKVYVFGSFVTKMYLPSGDIDIVVIMPGEYSANSSKMGAHHKLANALSKRRMTKNLQLINARVPLVKYIDSYANLKIDISVNVESGVQSSRIICDLSWKHPALYRLTLIVKQFLVIRGLNEVFTGGLGSYGLSAMITSFLLMHPRLRSGQISESDNVGVLLLEFFDLYGKRFNYDRVGISLRHRGRYFIKGRLGNLSNHRPDSLTIEDPQDIDNDITKGSFNMHMVVAAMSHAFDCLTTAIFEHLNRQSQYSDIKIRSLLSTIVHVEPEALKQREQMRELYQNLPDNFKSDTREFIDGLVPSNLTPDSFGPPASPVDGTQSSSPPSAPIRSPPVNNHSKPLSNAKKRPVERLDSSEDELLTKRQRKAKQPPAKRKPNKKKKNQK